MSIQRKLALWAALAALLPGLPLKADTEQQSDTISREEFNGLQGDLQTLRDDETRQFQRLTANTLRFVQFGGTIQTRYTFRDDGNPAYPNQLTIPLVQLTIRGSLYKDYADGHNLDFSLGLQSGSVTVPAGNANVTAFSLADANLTYAILATSDLTKPYLSVTLGQQLKIFGSEPQVTEAYKPTINPATWVANEGLQTRDIGLTFSGDFFPNADFGNNYRVALISYQLGLFNGSGQNTSTNVAKLPAGATDNSTAYTYPVADNNQDKDLYARIAFNAPVDYNHWARGLTLGFSAAQFHNPGANQGAAGNIVNGDLQSVRYGADLSYVNVPVGFTLEYIQGEDEQLTGTTPANTYLWVKQSYGGTATLFYEWGQQFVKDFVNQSRQDDYYPKTYQVFVRGDVWNPNSGGNGTGANATQNDVIIGTVGFNAWFASTTKFQFNYQARKNDIGYGSASFTSDQYLAQFQYGF